MPARHPAWTEPRRRARHARERAGHGGPASSIAWVDQFPADVLTAIGRLVIASSELESLLSWIGADRQGGDASKVFAMPGEPLLAARGAVEFAPAAYRDAYISAVREAGEALAAGQAVLCGMWTEHGPDASVGRWSVLSYRVGVGRIPDPASLDMLAVRLIDCRDHLRDLIDAQFIGQPFSSSGG